eukprot:1141379-Pelagomonas_calceolata.AAC.3
MKLLHQLPPPRPAKQQHPQLKSRCTKRRSGESKSRRDYHKVRTPQNIEYIYSKCHSMQKIALTTQPVQTDALQGLKLACPLCNMLPYSLKDKQAQTASCMP